MAELAPEAEPDETSSPSSVAEEDTLRTSSTAHEVEEEEVTLPTPTEGDEDTIEPMSTSVEGDEDLKETSLPPSELETSEMLAPQEESTSRTSSPTLESSENPSSSTPSSLPTSPLSWKMHQGGLHTLEEGDLFEEGDLPEDGGENSLVGEGPSSPSRPPEQPPPSPPPQPEPILAVEPKTPKRKAVAKKGALNYTVRQVVPAEKAEIVSVAKAMHRENFGKNVKALFHLEKEAALKSIQTGLYIGWRCPEYLWDCFRVGDQSKCFCGHLLKQHQVYVERRATVPCTVSQCKCQGFTFIPSLPEEVGEFWLRRRAGFDPATWRAKCRCKHTHEDHAATGARACSARGCSCVAFASNFLCAACDRRWEEHETFFESEETRRKGGRPCGEDYLPFAEMPELRNAVLTGRPEDNTAYRSLVVQGVAVLPASHALPLPPSGSRRRSTLVKEERKA